MTERLCEKCGSKLSANNTGVLCVHCKRASKSGTPGMGRVASPEHDTLKRFRMAAQTLGKDPDALLAGYAQRWLAGVLAKVDSIQD